MTITWTFRTKKPGLMTKEVFSSKAKASQIISPQIKSSFWWMTLDPLWIKKVTTFPWSKIRKILSWINWKNRSNKSWWLRNSNTWVTLIKVFSNLTLKKISKILNLFKTTPHKKSLSRTSRKFRIIQVKWKKWKKKDRLGSHPLYH